MKVKVSEKELLNPGYRRVYTPPSQEHVDVIKPGESKLHNLKKGQRVKPRRVRARRQALNEAGLIALMQAGGIGRPATYAVVMETLMKRKYVQRERNGSLMVTDRGRDVLAFLLSEYPDVFAVSYTRKMEQLLDDVATNLRTYKDVVRHFFGR